MHRSGRSRTLVASVLHQPAGNADDVPEHTLGKVLQHHLLLHLQLLVHTDGVQDEDGRHSFAVAGQQAAELGLQQLLALFKTGFLEGGEPEKVSPRYFELCCISELKNLSLLAGVAPAEGN